LVQSALLGPRYHPRHESTESATAQKEQYETYRISAITAKLDHTQRHPDAKQRHPESDLNWAIGETPLWRR
jgi:hypothetical protein